MNEPTTHFDSNQLLTELNEFRKAFTQRSFWSKSQAVRDNVLKAVTIVYLNCVDDSLANLFVSTMDEYAQRESYALLKGWIKV